MSSKHIFLIVLFVAVFGLIMSISNTNDLTGQADKTLKKLDDKRNPPKPGDFKEKPKSNSYASLGQGTFEVAPSTPAFSPYAPTPSISQGEFIINFHTSNTQYRPDVSASPDKFVVAWEDAIQCINCNHPPPAIFVRVFDANTGNSLTGDLNVENTQNLFDNRPHVAMAADSNFAVIWSVESSPSMDDADALIRFYDNTFNPIGPEFSVNSNPNGIPVLADVAALSNGNFVAIWVDVYEKHHGIFGQIYDPQGNLVGSEFQVHTTPIEFYDSSSFSVDTKEGEFIVVWDNLHKDGDWGGIFAQRFDNGGNTIDTEFQVNGAGVNHQESPAVSYLHNGDFVVAWDVVDSTIQTTIVPLGLYARHFDSSGTPLSTEFQVDSISPGVTKLNADIDGKRYQDGYVITWNNEQGINNDIRDVYSRIFTNADVPTATETIVNTYLPDEQESPSIAAYRSGYVIVWQSHFQLGMLSGSGYEVYGQRFDNADVSQ